MWFATREDIIKMTPLWTGERLPDGRPHVPASVLERLRNVNMEEAWGTLMRNGYKLMHQGGFHITQQGKRLVGRAVTATFMPSRPDLHDFLMKEGHEVQGRKGNYNQWVIDILQQDDVMVVDLYDKIINGTIVGGNLSTAINARTGKGGLVCWGGIRDLEQILTIDGLQVLYRGEDPTAIADCLMPFANMPTRIGNATVMPGDIVLGSVSGVIFIPAHLAEEVADTSEKIMLRDRFGFERLRQGTYTGAQIDAGWTTPLYEDFLQKWLPQQEDYEQFKSFNWDKELEDAKKRDEMVNASDVRLL